MGKSDFWTVIDAEMALIEVVRQGARGEALRQYCRLYGAKIPRRKRFDRFAETVRRTVAAMSGEHYNTAVLTTTVGV